MSEPVRPERREILALPRRPIRVVLDGVTLLPNIGTTFRLCDAFRVERLYVCGMELETHKRKLTKAAAGTIKWVAWESRPSAVDVVRECKAAGYVIAAVELAEGSVPPDAIHPDRPLCLVVGAERHGVSREVLAMVEQCIEIPTDGVGGSINLTTAAAIVLYEAAKRISLPAR